MNSGNNRTLGMTLVGIGLLFLVMRFVQFDAMAFLWPMWVIIPGAALLFAAFSQSRAQIGFAIPGAVVTGTGLILATFNTFGHWEAWAYAWALYPVFVGAALYFVGKRNSNADLQKNGNLLMKIGTYLFGGFAFFFELLIFNNAIGRLDFYVVPVVLIAAGLFLVLRGKNASDKQKRKVEFEA